MREKDLSLQHTTLALLTSTMPLPSQKKYGKNPQIWHGNVSEALLMKGNPDYYNDEVCKYGYFRGKQTVTYVKEVEEAYEIFKQQPK